MGDVTPVMARRVALRERIMDARRELAATYPLRFRCPWCNALHGERYDNDGCDPDCPHRGDYFTALDDEVRALRREALLDAS